MMDFLDSMGIEESFDYFDVQNLSIDHPLSCNEIDQYKALIFSPNRLRQIYFKDDVDIESIELIKDLLSISDYVDDSLVEKYIIKKFDDYSINALLDSIYENPSTWIITYDKNDMNYELADIPKCRRLINYIESLKNKDFSPLEQVLKVYDEVKLYDYVNQLDNSVNITSLIIDKKGTSYEFNKLFCYLLNSLGFKAYVGLLKNNDNKKSFYTIVDIKDDVYNIDGIYLFEPSLDNLPKNIYTNDDVRKMNYNYFGISLYDMNYLSKDDKLHGILSYIVVDDYDYCNEKIMELKSFELKKEYKTLMNTFNMSLIDLYSRIKNTNSISIYTIITAINSIYGKSSSINNYEVLLKENYNIRKNDLFNKSIEEEINDI